MENKVPIKFMKDSQIKISCFPTTRQTKTDGITGVVCVGLWQKSFNKKLTCYQINRFSFIV